MESEVSKQDIILRVQQRLVTWVNSRDAWNKINYPETRAHTGAIQDLEAILHPKGENRKAGKYN